MNDDGKSRDDNNINGLNLIAENVAVPGHISKLVPLGGNFRNAFINLIMEILECLNFIF